MPAPIRCRVQQRTSHRAPQVAQADVSSRRARSYSIDTRSIALAAFDGVALLLEAGQGSAGGVRQPAGCLRHLGEGGALAALQKRDHAGDLASLARACRCVGSGGFSRTGVPRLGAQPESIAACFGQDKPEAQVSVGSPALRTVRDLDLVDRETYKTRRSAALAEWQNLMA